ncbi:hypothetical protein ABKV19_014596 [Rosa sericea]
MGPVFQTLSQAGGIGDSYKKTSWRSSLISIIGVIVIIINCLASHPMPVVDVLDQRMSPPTHQVSVEVLSLMKVAFACLSSDPRSCPTMKQVSQQFETHQRLHLSKPLPMITLGELLALDGLALAI